MEKENKSYLIGGVIGGVITILILSLISLFGYFAFGTHTKIGTYLDLGYDCYSLQDISGFNGTLYVCESEQEQIIFSDSGTIIIPTAKICPYKVLIE